MIAILMFLVSLSASASEYEYFYKNANITHNTVDNAMWVKITAHGSSKKETDRVAKHARDAITEANNYFNNSNSRRCDEVTQLNVFFIDDKVLNNRNIMSFLIWEKWYNMDINGVYDGKTSPPGTASIFISKTPTGKSVKQLIAHEVAHYWEDQHCDMKVTEADANLFENHFMVSR